MKTIEVEIIQYVNKKDMFEESYAVVIKNTVLGIANSFLTAEEAKKWIANANKNYKNIRLELK